MSQDSVDAIAAILAEVERSTGDRVIPTASMIAEVLDVEQRAASEVVDPFYRDGPRLLGTLELRVHDVLRRYLGFVGQDGDAYANAARLWAFETFHDPTHRPDTVVTRFDLSGWPFNHIDWQAAGFELEGKGAFGRDLFIVDGHLFQRALTTGEEMALEDDWVRD